MSFKARFSAFVQEYDAWDLAIVAGISLVSAGVFKIYAPAGYITAGLALCIIGILQGRTA